MEISEVLRRLGIGRHYLGYSSTLNAIEMVLEDENRLFCLKQAVFVPLSNRQHCDWRTIERNIRTVIHRAWYVNPSFLMEMACYPLQQAPTVTEFIDMVSAYILRARVRERASAMQHPSQYPRI